MSFNKYITLKIQTPIMNKKLLILFFSVAFTLPCSLLKAQYPDVPKEVQEETQKMMGEAKRQSDLAWEKAFPIIKAEAEKGNPTFLGLHAQPIFPKPKFRRFRALMVGRLTVLADAE